ncbi:hypothetical protein UP09_30970 [Bradyrhizobium sp. LTSP885]|uniref:hypothetical protein n=1 Tax=Bradyrhizobium sp. LTSP885 TaxID=1619232 RepID=UPI0005C9B00F|nr:hypothetical protein [Bradyrhizobium sp. LTSP885]KJC35648.1 hypothetical protein UP09_30970 [Bradyrhizobium sp. LTSP885]
MANLQQHSNLITIWNVSNPSACVQYQISSVGAREFMDRDANYVETLTAGQTPDPTKSGRNRIIIDGFVGQA